MSNLQGVNVVEQLRGRCGRRREEAHVVIVQHVHQGHEPVGL